MPLGDPHGGNFQYTTEGLPDGIVASVIPCSDPSKAVSFYCDILKMETVAKKKDGIVLKNGNGFIILQKSENYGIDTGIYLKIDSPYEFHRRMADEGVVFLLHPTKTELGLELSFKDFDGNIIHGIEIQI